MERKLNSIESGLTKAVEEAMECSKTNTKNADPFGAELENAMNWYAFTLPSMLQQDGVTVKETMPSVRKIEIITTSGNEGNNLQHKLIKEIRPGRIILEHPVLYKVKQGDSLWKISRSVCRGKASVPDLKRWNRQLSDDNIQPGQELWLANPDDELVKNIKNKFSTAVLRSPNPEIELARLSSGIVNKYAGLMAANYQVQIHLQYDELPQYFVNPSFLSAPDELKGPWAPPPANQPNFGPPFLRDQLFPDGTDHHSVMHNKSGGNGLDWQEVSQLIGNGMWTTNTAVGTVSGYTVFSGGYYKWNEVWHKTKTAGTAFRWQSRWNKGVAPMQRAKQIKTVADARNLNGKLTKAGGVLLVADIALSGEVKPSHAINAAMLGASTTGVGAIVAGVWFIADFGTMGTNYLINGEAKGIGDMIDDSIGTYEMYEGLY